MGIAMNDNHCPSYRLDSHRPHINAQQADLVKLQERVQVLEFELDGMRSMLKDLFTWADNWLPDEAKDQGAREVLRTVRAVLSEEAKP